MKPRFHSPLLALPLVIALHGHAFAAPVNKAATGTDLTAGASWGGTAPGSGDVATWISTSLGAGLTIGSDTSWQGIDVQGALGAIGITGAGRLTLGSSGITIAAAGQNLTISNGLTVDATQAWNVGTGRTLTLNTGTTGLNAGTILTLQGAGTVDMAQAFVASSSGALVVDGAKLIVNSSGANRSGSTTLTSGIIALMNNSTALGTGQLNLNGGLIGSNSATNRALANAVSIGGNVGFGGTGLSTGTVTLSGLTNLGGAVRTLTTAVNTTFSNVISNGGITKAGNGTLTLSNSNTYSDGTTVNAGTLTLGHASNTLADAGAVTVSGGTLALGANSDTVGAVTLTSGSITGSTGVLTGSSYDVSSGTISAILGGSGIALAKGTSGTVTLSGANTYSGGTALSTGTLILGNASAIGTGALTITGGLLDSSVASLVNSGNNAQNWNGDFSFVGTQNLDLGTGAVTMNANRQVTVTANTLTVGGAISGSSFSLTKVGNGTLALTNSNTYAGGTTISGGTLTLGHASNTLANAGAVTVSGGTMALGANSDTVGSVTLTSGSITGSTGVLTGSSYDVSSGTISAILGGSGIALAKGTSGTVTLSGANTYSGGSTLSAGILRIGNNSALGSGALTLNGGTLSSDSGTTRTLANNLTIGGNVALGDGTNAGELVLNGTMDLQGSTRTLTSVLSGQGARFNGVISNGDLTKEGTGRITLANDTNTFTGVTTINAGILATSTGALATSTSLSIGAAGSLALGSNGTTIINNLGGVTGSVIRSDFNITANGARTLQINQTTAGEFAGSFTQGGSRQISLIKTGSATLTMSGGTGYTGTTTVTDGKLIVNGNISTSTLTTVQTGATIGGSGTVGALTIDGNGTLAPGTSPGTLNTGILTLTGSSISAFELNPADQGIGLNINDLVSVTGNFTLDGILNVVATSGNFLSSTNGDTWRLFNYTGSLTDNTLTLGSMPALGSGLSWDVDTATTGQVNLVVVPEPRAALLGGLGLLVLLRRRRD